MNKKYLFLVLLLLANLLPVVAGTNENLSTNALCNVTVVVDQANNVKIVTKGGGGTELPLQDGSNTLQVDDSDTPLLVDVKNGAVLVLCKLNGEECRPGGGGKIRLSVTDGMKIEVTTKSPSTNAVVTFSVTDPLHILVKTGENIVTNLSVPLTVDKGALMNVTATEGYVIKKVSAGGRTIVESAGRIYYFAINEDMTVSVTSQVADPYVKFEIGIPGRVKVSDKNTGRIIDIATLGVDIPKGTVLKIESSDAKYKIKSLSVDGVTKPASGSAGIYECEITANATIAIETSSTMPAIKYGGNKPEDVKVHLLGSDQLLNSYRYHELEMGAQLVIEAASDQVRIASVIANGLKLTPLKDGTYLINVLTDMVFEITTKSNLPILTFNVDAPERIDVWKGTEKLDITGEVDLAKGTEIVIAPAADNFSIKSVKADGNELAAGPDKKYHATVSGNTVFEIKTDAMLTLHIIQPEGGKIMVFRGETELHEGDKVKTNDELIFKSTPDKSYVFMAYLLNGEKYADKYTVTGSRDLTVTGEFRAVKEGYALLTFDFDTKLMNVWEIGGENVVFIKISEPYEIKKGTVIQVFVISKGLSVKSCTANGVEVAPDDDARRSFTIKVENHTLIKATTEHKVTVTGVYSHDEFYDRIGRIDIKYKGETAEEFSVPVGESVELVPVPMMKDYKLENYFLNYDQELKFTENSYTVKPEDLENHNGLVVIKGNFVKLDNIENTNVLQSYYDAATMQIRTNGGETRIYTISGELVLGSAEMNIDVSALENGVYVVKTQDKVFKLIKN